MGYSFSEVVTAHFLAFLLRKILMKIMIGQRKWTKVYFLAKKSEHVFAKKNHTWYSQNFLPKS